ncbi:MAG: TMEM165/GDT1 family protein [Candidatus Brocadiia bacterium]
MLEDLLMPLGLVAVAELGDKTQLSILLLSSRTNRHLALLFGVTLAFLIVDGAAILIGSCATSFLPMTPIKIGSGVVFILCGLVTLRSKPDEGEAKAYSGNPFLAGFGLILLTEWGDKTQIVAGLFATQYNPLWVLLGTMVALIALSVMAIYLGRFLGAKLNKRLISKIAGAVFILIGVVVIMEALVSVK